MNSAQNECVAGLRRRTISGIGAGEPTSKNAGLVPGGTACEASFGGRKRRKVVRKFLEDGVCLWYNFL